MTIKRLIRATLPNGVRRMVAGALRGRCLPPQAVRNLLAHDGAFTVAVAGHPVRLRHTQRWIENDLYWKGAGAYEGVSLRVWVHLARAARVVLDVGANTGLFALVAKRANPTAEVVAFEPLAMFRDTLVENLGLNHMAARVEPLAVSNFVGPARFFVPEELQGNVYSSSLSREHFLNHQTSRPREFDVEVTTLDRYLTEAGMPPPDLMKVDAEGHDAEVLEGMGGYLAAGRPSLIVEVRTEATVDRISRLVDPLGYVCFDIDEVHGLRPTAALSPSTTFNCLICTREVADRLPAPLMDPV